MFNQHLIQLWSKSKKKKKIVPQCFSWWKKEKQPFEDPLL